eukprot:Opistho-2@88193
MTPSASKKDRHDAGDGTKSASTMSTNPVLTSFLASFRSRLIGYSSPSSPTTSIKDSLCATAFSRGSLAICRVVSSAIAHSLLYADAPSAPAVLIPRVPYSATAIGPSHSLNDSSIDSSRSNVPCVTSVTILSASTRPSDFVVTPRAVSSSACTFFRFALDSSFWNSFFFAPSTGKLSGGSLMYPRPIIPREAVCMVGRALMSSNHAFPLYPKQVSMMRTELTTSPLRNAMRWATVCDTLPPVESNVSWSTEIRCVSVTPLAYVTITISPKRDFCGGRMAVIPRPLMRADISTPAAASFWMGRNWYAPRMNCGEHPTPRDCPGQGIPGAHSTRSHVLPSVHQPCVFMRWLEASTSSNDGFSTWFPSSLTSVPGGRLAIAASTLSAPPDSCCGWANGASLRSAPSPMGESNSTRSFALARPRLMLSLPLYAFPIALPLTIASGLDSKSALNPFSLLESPFLAESRAAPTPLAPFACGIPNSSLSVVAPWSPFPPSPAPLTRRPSNAS